MQQEQQHNTYARENRIEGQQVPEGADVVHVLIDRYPSHQISEGNTPQKRWKQASEENNPIPCLAPFWIRELAAEFEGHPASN
ncbi:hypothetical protein D3C80_1775090 [compost metagenome]